MTGSDKRSEHEQTESSDEPDDEPDLDDAINTIEALATDDDIDELAGLGEQFQRSEVSPGLVTSH